MAAAARGRAVTGAAAVLLEGAAAEDPRLVGHKFARQAELRRHGFAVPDFFCIPVTAFAAALAGRPDDDGAGDPEERAARRRERIAGAPVPAGLARAVRDRFDALFGPDGLAAVRACTVGSHDDASEDSAADPFAGLSDSFLGVGRDELLARVADCWASGFNPRAVRYRRLRGLDPLAVGVAVGVQRMVPAARSFVAFSRNPLGDPGQCLIAAAYGLGEGVVQERADVDHFAVDRHSGAVAERILVTKARSVGPGPGGRGTVDRPVAPELADPAVLTDAEAAAVADLAVRVEAHYSVPQDVEGAITAAGEIVLLQARPALVAAPATGPDVAFTNSNAVESYPGVSGALTYSVAGRLCEAVFDDYYRRMGVPAAALRAHRHELHRMLVHVQGRIYYRLDSWYRMHSLLPGFDRLRSTWEPAIGLKQGAAGPARRPSLGRVLWDAALLPVAVARTRRRIEAALRWWDATFAAALERGAATPDRLVAEHHRLWAELGERWGLPSVNNFHALSAVRLTNALVARWARGARPAVLTGMMTGGRESRSAAALRSAVELAERVRARPELLAAHGAPAEVWRRLEAGEFGADLARAARQHVRTYGDRGPQDLKLETVTVRSAPWQLLPTLVAYAEQGLTAAGSRERERAVRADAERELREHCPDPLRRAVIRRLYATIRECARLREDTRFGRSQIVGVMRDTLLALGADLARAGVLDDARDVLDLTVDEVLGAYQGTTDADSLRALAAARRARRAEWAARPDPPPLFRAAAGEPLGRAVATGRLRLPPPADAADRLAGIGSSPGRVRARARVVLDPHLDVQECRGRILVARETDPGWLFLMVAAAGVIVEHGSPLSHTAITGRVLAIPTVVGVAGATARIRDGDWVELDGSTGVVARLAGPPPEALAEAAGTVAAGAAAR
ncbi:PEP/pyruvate-binding domain-containing protein [Dactylosporangium sp. NPDC051541]|uniref:PEP/pyruvate-binding domain-containing protein n=1 Tax=Dactylosporangium sp. NPDC051541 TaxID=3363977 RepID=UPI00378D3236